MPSIFFFSLACDEMRFLISLAVCLQKKRWKFFVLLLFLCRCCFFHSVTCVLSLISGKFSWYLPSVSNSHEHHSAIHWKKESQKQHCWHNQLSSSQTQINSNWMNVEVSSKSTKQTKYSKQTLGMFSTGATLSLTHSLKLFFKFFFHVRQRMVAISKCETIHQWV